MEIKKIAAVLHFDWYRTWGIAEMQNCPKIPYFPNSEMSKLQNCPKKRKKRNFLVVLADVAPGLPKTPGKLRFLRFLGQFCNLDISELEK